MIRLTSDFWVQSYITRLSLVGIPAFVTLKGDLNAGAVFIKINTLNGLAIAYHRSFNPDTLSKSWVILSEGKESDVDKVLFRQKSYDPDIWIIEVEDKLGRNLLEEEGLRN